ncbi:MAG: hypothetical protein QG575_1632 [Euryarchaeota archaeon]|nr:hypothetical protein [Euryarchaeota archaeon]
MSHFSFADESCKHGSDVGGRVDTESEDNGGMSGEEEIEEEYDGEGKDGEDAATSANDVLLAAANSRWHDTMEVPITATDLSALLMMRRISSSLLPG